MRRRAGIGMACAVALLVAPAQAPAAPTAAKSVIGGTTPQPGALPAVVAVEFRNGGVCTGAVVAPTTVVTAAHCLEERRPSEILVRLGSSEAGRGGTVVPVTAAVQEPAYANDVGPNDIGVLKLASPTIIPPLPIASASEDASLTLPGAPLTVAGYGQSNARVPDSVGRLLSAQVFVRTGCGGKRYKPGFNPATMVCAYGQPFKVVKARLPGTRKRSKATLQRAACYGDSGGPLIADTPSGRRLVGVVSHGAQYPKRFGIVDCAVAGFPDVYTRAAAFQAFIQPYL